MKTYGARSKGGSKGVSLTGVLKHLLPPLVLFLFFAAAGVVHVTSRVIVVDTGYALSRLETEQRALSRENARLKLELATLKSPARLEQLARTKLNMVPPPPGSVLSAGKAKARPLPTAASVGAPIAQRSAP